LQGAVIAVHSIAMIYEREATLSPSPIRRSKEFDRSLQDGSKGNIKRKNRVPVITLMLNALHDKPASDNPGSSHPVNTFFSFRTLFPCLRRTTVLDQVHDFHLQSFFVSLSIAELS